MGRVPRYGTHDGIKYTPRRTIFNMCEVCGTIILNPTRGKKYCSQQCYDEAKAIIDIKNDYKFNAHKTYQPPQSEEERNIRNQRWRTWYNNLTAEQKIRYNNKKKRNNKKTEDTVDSIRAEMEALGLR